MEELMQALANNKRTLDIRWYQPGWHVTVYTEQGAMLVNRCATGLAQALLECAIKLANDGEAFERKVGRVQ